MSAYIFQAARHLETDRIKKGIEMKLLLVVRIIGWLQLISSILLIIATIGVYSYYQSSLGDMSRSLASAVLSVSDGITKVATTIEVRQELIDHTAEVLVSSRKLVADLKSSAETQATMLPRYVASIRDTSTAMAKAGDNMVNISSKIQGVTVPTSMRMDGIKPVVVFTRPLENQEHLLSLGKEGESVKRLSGTVASIADSVNTDAKKVNAGFIDMSQKTLQLIDQSVKATEKLKSQDLPLAISAIKVTADNLRQASAEAKGMEQFANKLLIAGLALGILFALNSVGVLLIAQSLNKRDSDGFAGTQMKLGTS